MGAEKSTDKERGRLKSRTSNWGGGGERGTKMRRGKPRGIHFSHLERAERRGQNLTSSSSYWRHSHNISIDLVGVPARVKNSFFFLFLESGRNEIVSRNLGGKRNCHRVLKLQPI